MDVSPAELPCAPGQTCAAPGVQLSIPVKTILDLKRFSNKIAVLEALQKYRLSPSRRSRHTLYIRGEFQELRRFRTDLYNMTDHRKSSIRNSRSLTDHEYPITKQPVSWKDTVRPQAAPTPGEHRSAATKAILEQTRELPVSRKAASLRTPSQISATPGIQLSMPVTTFIDLKCFSDGNAVMEMMRKYNFNQRVSSDTTLYITGEFHELRRFRTDLYDMIDGRKSSIRHHRPSSGHTSLVTGQPVRQKDTTGHRAVTAPDKSHSADNPHRRLNTDLASHDHQERVSSQRHPKPPPTDEREPHQGSRTHLSRKVSERGPSAAGGLDRSDGSSFSSSSQDVSSHLRSTSAVPVNTPGETMSASFDRLSISADVKPKSSPNYSQTSKGPSDFSPTREHVSSSATPRERSSKPAKVEDVPAPRSLTGSFPVDTAILKYMMCFRNESLQRYTYPGNIKLDFEHFQEFSNVILSVPDAKFSEYLEPKLSLLSLEFEKYQSILRAEDIDLTEYPAPSRAHIAREISQIGNKMEILTEEYERGIHLIGPSTSILGFIQNWKAKAHFYQREMRGTNQEANVDVVSPRFPRPSPAQDSYTQSPARRGATQRVQTQDSHESGRRETRNGSTRRAAPGKKPNSNSPHSSQPSRK